MNFVPDLHHRRSIRARGFDYRSAGAYFVTVCVQSRECLLGEIVDGVVRLTGVGEMVRDEWSKTAEIRKEVHLDEFVVMPNHFHGILWLDDEKTNVGATRWVAQLPMSQKERATHQVAPTGPVSGSLGAIIGQFKSITTKRVNAIRSTPGLPLWQRNYYERIIRDEDELLALREYILMNPLRWGDDEENPQRTADGS